MSLKQIWVDADACPKVIKEILFRAADRASVPVTLVANQALQVPRSPHIRSIQVAAGFDVADNHIVQQAEEGDLVITADIPLAAEAIAKSHSDHPIAFWRNRFQTVLDHAAETRVAFGEQPKDDEKGDRGNRKDDVKNMYREPVLSIKSVGNTVELVHANLKQCTMGIYVMNLEFLFSKNPFIENDHGHFLHIQPNYSAAVVLGKDGKTAVTIPAKYKNKNLLIEFSGGGKRAVQSRVTSGLVTYIEQNRGQLKVVDAKGKPVAAAYVKVYAYTTDGKVKFYKDGYTDLRGRISYASLNSSGDGRNPISKVNKFAILVATTDRGSVIKETGSPTAVLKNDPLADDDLDIDW